MSSRPSFTFDPLFHAGTYYVQEASSMLLEQALKQHLDLNADLRVLDLCAAPGGKSTHIQSIISPNSLLVSNEVIRSRATVLRDNVLKWGSSNVVVLNNDPAHFQKLPAFFDAMVVDAPCSGSGLFRRDPDAFNEWSPEQVSFCAQRQKRILADVLPALRENGLLIYSTCSYSLEEDELLLEWLMNEYDLESLPLQLEENWQIVEVKSGNAYGYRCWPHLLKR
ncbi:MAG: RsmB/NOP family class I SAM-dependent RNA methyltransferase [Chitinophagaceae bacterium]|nr:RsmB/NOP family class I SAM-dependent RNA methyltransferase [Chitinophagaceae bacterium]